MSYRAGILTGALATLFIVGLGTIGSWIAGSHKPATSSAAPASPAKVAHVLKEETVNSITLVPAAEARLGIRIGTVEKKAVRRTRSIGGEVTLPPGSTMLVAAPLSGMVQAPPGGMPVAGRPVRKGQALLLFSALLTPEARTTIASARVDAEGQVNNAQAQLDATRIAHDRAKRLLSENAGSQRNVDEAQAAFELATKTLAATQARLDLLKKLAGEVGSGTAAPIAIEAPESGLLRSVSAMPGQTVPAGAALFEIADLARVWIRVPVYVGDLAEIDTAQSAGIGDLSGRPGSPSRSAKPAAAPPTANAVAATADIYYELDNPDGRLAPGQRVGVTLPLKGDTESLVVPWSAIIHDIQGGTWVYQQNADREYSRRRVRVRYVIGDSAVLAAGLPAGARVVVTGAAELFGTEVGFSK